MREDEDEIKRLTHLNKNTHNGNEGVGEGGRGHEDMEVIGDSIIFSSAYAIDLTHKSSLNRFTHAYMQLYIQNSFPSIGAPIF